MNELISDHNGKLFVETVGRQTNLLDSELVVAFRKEGYELTSDIDAADTVLFNTCSVRERASDVSMWRQLATAATAQGLPKSL